MPEDRTLTVRWDDPLVLAAAGRTMSGLDYLRSMMRGELPGPPIMHLMQMSLLEVEEGHVVFTGLPAEFHYNPIGVVHGGFASTLLDSAMACAITSTHPLGVGSTTLDLHINFVRPITMQTGIIRAIGDVIHVGRRMATAQGRLIDADGKLYAHGTTTCMVFPLESSGG